MTGWWWAIAAVVVAVGLTAAFWLGRRGTTHDAIPDQTLPIAWRAFAASPAGQAVIAADGEVVLANEVARQLGLVRDGALDARVADRAVNALERPGNVGPDDWETPGLRGRDEVLRLRARPLGDGLVLVIATDETASRRAEILRRDFVANVSHELKSPVTALGLLAEAVLEAADSPETVSGFAQQMQRESSRLGTLISEIIALTAIQGGALHEVDLVPIDAAIADAVDRATVGARAADITIAADEPIGAEVLGDRGLITTAIGNLVDNAVHYSEQGATVKVTRVVRRGCVDIAVADTGIGISAPDQRRVFERFFRVDPARSRATGGTGLGLAIVKHVAANHGGSIRLASRVGVGSTFTLRLPLAGTVDAPKLMGAEGSSKQTEAEDQRHVTAEGPRQVTAEGLRPVSTEAS